MTLYFFQSYTNTFSDLFSDNNPKITCTFEIIVKEKITDYSLCCKLQITGKHDESISA